MSANTTKDGVAVKKPKPVKNKVTQSSKGLARLLEISKLIDASTRPAGNS